MHVLDGLPGVGAGVEDHPVAPVRESLAGRDLVRVRDDLSQQAVARFRKLGQVRMMSACDNEHMYGRLRIDISEGDSAPIVGHYGGRQVAGRNGAEEALRHGDDLNVSPARDAADIYGCTTANPR